MNDVLKQIEEALRSDSDGRRDEALDAAYVEIDRLRANHKDVVETKRGTDARLKVALAGLQQIYTVCGDNAPESCDHEKALAFVRQVSGDVFEAATNNVPRSLWQNRTPSAETVAALLEAEDASAPSPSDYEAT